MPESVYRQGSFQHRVTGAAIVLSFTVAIMGLIGFSIVESSNTVLDGTIIIGGIVISFVQIAIGLGLFFNTTWGSPLAKVFYGFIFMLSLLEAYTTPGVLTALILTLVYWGDPDDF